MPMEAGSPWMRLSPYRNSPPPTAVRTRRSPSRCHSDRAGRAGRSSVWRQGPRQGPRAISTGYPAGPRAARDVGASPPPAPAVVPFICGKDDAVYADGPERGGQAGRRGAQGVGGRDHPRVDSCVGWRPSPSPSWSSSARAGSRSPATPRRRLPALGSAEVCLPWSSTPAPCWRSSMPPNPTTKRCRRCLPQPMCWSSHRTW